MSYSYTICNLLSKDPMLTCDVAGRSTFCYLHRHRAVAIESLPLHRQRRADVVVLPNPKSMQQRIAQCSRWGWREPANRRPSMIHPKPKA